MGSPPCPRCARPGGLPVAYGFPGGDMEERAERGEIVLGGCVMDAGSPGLHCRFCAHWWSGGLPEWWPPEDTANLVADERDRARRELADRLERARVVADAFEHNGIEAATAAAGAYRRFRARERPDAPLVPSDCVHLAGALDAAEALTRILDPARERYSASDEFVLLGPDDVHQAFRHADDARDRDTVDVLHPEDDSVLSFVRDFRLRDADPSAALVQRGDGSELPAVGPTWSRRLDRVAAEVFDDGSGHGWTRFLWSRLTLPAITSELDVTRGAVRVVALGVLRRALLDRLDGDSPGDPWIDVANPGIGSFHLGRLTAVDEATPVHGYDPARPDETTAEVDAIRVLARREGERLAVALVDAVGADDLVACTWASGHPCTRYPLGTEARAAALDPGRNPGVHRARSWVAAGMPV